jgi:hypothetical protein
MEKIKDLTKVILTPDAIFGEMIKPKRFIIAPDGTKDEDSYIVIISVGENVKDMKAGDIIVKYGGGLIGYKFKDTKGVDREVVIASRGAVLIGSTSENFIDPDVLAERVSI